MRAKFASLSRLLLGAGLSLGACLAGAAPAVSVELARDGKALLPVTIAATAGEAARAEAATLAEYLGKISGAVFTVAAGDGSSGLAVGTAADFPDLAAARPLAAAGPEESESYLLRTHARGAYLIGASELGVRHAVWDFLRRLGYRQFFPGSHWEIIPSRARLAAAVDDVERPVFLGRRIWYGHGDWPDNVMDKARWDARNRVAAGIGISSGHAYDAIYRAKKTLFDLHPEYLTAPGKAKFCISNPGLRQLVVDYALEYFSKNPQAQSISMEPSDGGGWERKDGACQDEKIFRSITDRVVDLANHVAVEVNKKYPGKYVGIYAYYQHSPPPTIKVHPRVVVSVATRFITGGFTVDQLMQGWGRQGARLGIREYYNVVVWNKDRPGGPPAADFDLLAANIKRYAANGVRFMSAESSDSWGPAGLGYYLAAYLLWNPQGDVQALKDDFFRLAFGAAEKPMREWYDLIDGARRPLFSRHLVGSMYRRLEAAYALSQDPGVRARLDDLVLYTRYAELLFNLLSTPGEGQMANTEAILKLAYRSRNRHLVHSYALWRDTRGGFATPTGDTTWNIPEGKNPWKDSTLFPAGEIAAFLKQGIDRNPLFEFTPRNFSKDLVPAGGPLRLDAPRAGSYGYVRYKHALLLWVEKPGTVELEVTGGVMRKEPDPGSNTTLGLFAVDDPESKELASARIPNDKTAHKISLKTPHRGLHRLEVDPRSIGAHISWPAGMPAVFASSVDEPVVLSHRINMYFYVPKGTPGVGFFADGPGLVLDGEGKKVLELPARASGYYHIPVAPGQDGRAWQLVNSAGQRLLMTVPPYLARHPAELLLPREVAAAGHF